MRATVTVIVLCRIQVLYEEITEADLPVIT